jgi:hypothetical protein
MGEPKFYVRARRATVAAFLVASLIGTAMLALGRSHAGNVRCAPRACRALAVALHEPRATAAPSPLVSPARPAHRPAPKKRIPAIDRRVILMHPPYDLRRRRVALTCGYHDSCKRYPERRPAYLAGDGLDWNDNNGTVPVTKAVFFTASARAAVPGTRIATVSFTYHRPGRDPGFPCATLVANVRAYPSGRVLFRVMYEHTVPIRSLRAFGVYAGVPSAVPDVVARIGTMTNDPCPYFTKNKFHVHVEPLDHDAGVAYAKNMAGRGRLREIPDVNGCGDEACAGPAYPGPRWRRPYYALWTFRWTWYASRSTGAPRRG